MDKTDLAMTVLSLEFLHRREVRNGSCGGDRAG